MEGLIFGILRLLTGSLKGTRILQSLSLKLSLHAIAILLQYPLEMFVVLPAFFLPTALKCTS